MLKKIECLNSKSGKIRQTDKIAVISELRQKYKLTALLEVAQLPRSTYYYYIDKAKKPDKYTKIKEEIIQIYHENQGCYGYRRITLELHNRGYQVNHKTVQRLMKILVLKCMIRMKRYPSYKGQVGKIVPNLIKRNFRADAPNQKWITDITEFSLFGTKLYLSLILDMYNGEIISYNINEHLVLNQVLDKVDKGFLKIPDNTNLIFETVFLCTPFFFILLNSFIYKN